MTSEASMELFDPLLEGLTNEQEVRRDIVIAMLNQGSLPVHVERDATNLTKFVMDGAKDRTRYGRIHVLLPGTDPSRPPEARAWMTPEGFLQIEFREEDLGRQLLRMIRDEDPVVIDSISFNYRPAQPVDTTKDN